jgi:hypothetical protein
VFDLAGLIDNQLFNITNCFIGIVVSIDANELGRSRYWRGYAARHSRQEFDPFFTTKPVGKGTGLGLSQVYGFVKQSGGHINIYSEPGQGTTIKLYFPRFFGAVESVAKPHTVNVVPTGTAQQIILVVEDEEEVRQSTGDMSRELGYTVIAVDSAAAALRVLAKRPDLTLLFTDVVCQI